jgi:hypothetical protein
VREPGRTRVSFSATIERRVVHDLGCNAVVWSCACAVWYVWAGFECDVETGYIQGELFLASFISSESGGTRLLVWEGFEQVLIPGG